MLEYLQPASCETPFLQSAKSSSTSCLNKSPSNSSISWPFISPYSSMNLFIWHLRALKCLRNRFHLFNQKKKTWTLRAAQNLSDTFGVKCYVDSCLGNTRHLFLKVVDVLIKVWCSFYWKRMQLSSPLLNVKWAYSLFSL